MSGMQGLRLAAVSLAAATCVLLAVGILQVLGLVDSINASGADVVLVAFGNPAQETWILEHCDACDAPLMFGVGALLDFLSGNARRAPPWVRRLHLEWLYRLACEPRRLLRRYTWDLARFFRICLASGQRF